jgi:hypothetical protein
MLRKNSRSYSRTVIVVVLTPAQSQNSCYIIANRDTASLKNVTNVLPETVLLFCIYGEACYHELVTEFNNSIQFNSVFISVLTQQNNEPL